MSDPFAYGPTDGVPTRVFIEQDYVALGGGVQVWLTQTRNNSGGPVTTIGQPVDIVMVDHPDHTAPPTEPTMRLPENAARALLDALSKHFGGTTDVMSLRRDYDAERKRVDRMIDHLTRGGTG